MKAASQDRTVSDVMNDAVREALVEDLADLEAVKARKSESVIDLHQLVASMKRRGKL